MEKRLTCCENRQKNWYKNCGVIKHTFYKIKHNKTHTKTFKQQASMMII